jgi:iron(III) transport system permease protein
MSKRYIDLSIASGGHFSAPAWLVAAVAAAILICALPIVSLIVVALAPEIELWRHLATYVLPYAARDTALLVAGVGLSTGLIGVALAALVSLTEFPGRRFVAAAAILPLAFPIYLHAFVYVELLDAAGPVQSFLRGWLGSDIRLPEVRSIGGAIAIFALVLYPYVYLPLSLALAAQPRDYRDAARVLGCSSWSAFRRVQLPAARHAFAAGLTLALMETLADFGASEYLGVRTFAYVVYSTWMTRDSLAGAAQIALVLVCLVMTLIVVEAYARRAALHRRQPARADPAPRAELGGAARIAACAFSWSIVVVAFAVPAAFLGLNALRTPDFATAVANLVSPSTTSAYLAATAASAILACALTIALLQRWDGDRLVSRAANACSLGYAVPGVVLALGLLFASGAIDNRIDALAKQAFGVSTGLLLGGTPLILLLAYFSRFMAVGQGPVHGHMRLIATNLDHVARTLGRSPAGVAREVLLPQLAPTCAAVWLLLAVDIVKELPMTLLLRPIGIETLATSLYGHASRGQFEDGSLEALAMLLCGILAVLALQRLVRRGLLRLA